MSKKAKILKENKKNRENYRDLSLYDFMVYVSNIKVYKLFSTNNNIFKIPINFYCKLSSIEIENFVKIKSNDFDIDKLEAILCEIDSFEFIEIIEMFPEYAESNEYVNYVISENSNLIESQEERDDVKLVAYSFYVFKDIVLKKLIEKKNERVIKDSQHIQKAQEKKVNKYYKTCYPSHIELARSFKKENGDKNENYIYDLLANYERQQEVEIMQINNIESDIHERLKQENKLICLFFSDVFKLYDAVCEYKNTSNANVINRINRYELDVEHRFSHLNYHSAFVTNLVINNRFNEAKVVKRFIENNFQNLLNHFSSYFGIKLKESPLKRKVLSYQNQLKSAISFEEVEYSNSSGNNNEKQKYTGRELALAYIFELYSQGKQIPVNQTEGGYSKKKIEEDCHKFKDYVKPNTVYNAIRNFKKDEIDFNSAQHLKNISLRWSDVVLEFASKPKELKKYLEENQLIKV